MAKKDFSAASTKRVYDQIAEATQETPEAPAAQEEQETPKKRYKDRKEYSEEEAAAFLDSFKSAGRKGIKLPRINMAFTPENYIYIRRMARARGESYTEFLNWLIKTHRDQNAETYDKINEFLDTM